MNPGQNRGRRAFTLIEIMIAIMIFTMIIAAIYSTWSLILRAARTGQEAAAQAQRQRITVHTIEDSLTCIQSFQASWQYYSFIVQNGEQPVLSFAARLPDAFPRNGKFGAFNSRRVTFTVEPGHDSGNNLVLRQAPILMDMDQDEQQYPLVLARDVKNFTIECWDTNVMDWATEWEHTNSIPPLIRVSLVLGTRNSGSPGTPSPDLSITRVIAVPSSQAPSIVQGRAGGTGGGGPSIKVGNLPAVNFGGGK